MVIIVLLFINPLGFINNNTIMAPQLRTEYVTCLCRAFPVSILRFFQNFLFPAWLKIHESNTLAIIIPEN